ncbi:MAG: ABC transporter ATP-binding protein [Rhizobiaceae bacterium]
MSALEISGLCVRFGSQEILKGIGLEAKAGEFIGLIGPNGAGKSTLLRAVGGLLAYDGQIAIEGKPARQFIARERAKRVAYLAQEREVAWDMSVETVVALGRSPHMSVFAPPSDGDRTAVEAAMRTMEIALFRDRPATELSGGEKARVLIARALAQESPILLLDEPTAGLDPAHKLSLMRIFVDLAAQGRTVIASLHDLGLAARWCSRLILLEDGKVAADGQPAAVLTDERLASVYGVAAYRAEAKGLPIIQPIDLTGVSK